MRAIPSREPLSFPLWALLCSALGCLVFGLFIGLLIGLTIARQQTVAQQDDQPKPQQPNPQPPPKPVIDWAATGNIATADPAVVSIVDALVEKHRTWRQTGGGFQDGGRYLTVPISIATSDPVRNVRLSGWRNLSLQDEHGNVYKQLVVPPTARLWDAAGQTFFDLAPLQPGQATADRPLKGNLFFEVPSSAAKELRLSLPAEAVGAKGTVHLKFPFRP